MCMFAIMSDINHKKTSLRSFLLLTAMLEGLTGIALIALPRTIGLFLLGEPDDGFGETILMMLAGAAIFSLATICWLLRDLSDLSKLVAGMIIYNIVIAAVSLYGILNFGISGPGFWLIVIAHSGLTVWGLFNLRSA
jgi:hypothetical protein